uniref:PUA-like domain-containing protein n=1 Tax=Candidatus Kentrum sp. SD TaxID=2126332 RepID=A0A450YJW8_9GAMM|nr:MAG: PUA-like domain-containing protein [Candidatus Kentron sp. SD]VFK47666.1 MAG: PUA-like domain-containing protein [Candidatus Kentron sp. SD]
MLQIANEPRHGLPRELIIDEADAAALKTASVEYPAHTLSPRQIRDLELLLNGGFSLLIDFMDRQTYEKVLDDLRLGDGTIWPMPIVLDVANPWPKNRGPAGNSRCGTMKALRLPCWTSRISGSRTRGGSPKGCRVHLPGNTPGHARSCFEDARDY